MFYLQRYEECDGVGVVPAGLAEANSEVAALLASLDNEGSAFVSHLPADASEDDQVAELVERAMLGDFDEGPSSAELQDYAGFSSSHLRDSGQLYSANAHSSPAAFGAGSFPDTGGCSASGAKSPELSDSASAAADSLHAMFGSTSSAAGQALPTTVSRTLLSSHTASSQGTARPVAASITRPSASPESRALTAMASSSQKLPEASWKEKPMSMAKQELDAVAANGVQMPWSADEKAQPSVKAALDLRSKLDVAVSLSKEDSRRPLWLGAVAIKASQLGIAAVERVCFSSTSACYFVA
jgi:hypothetical protein